MLSLTIAPALWLFITIAWFAIGLFVYVALIRQISVRTSGPSEGSLVKRFGLPEAVIATLMMSLLVINLAKGGAESPGGLTTELLINSLVFTVVIVFILIAFLIFRGFDLDALAGFSKVGIIRAVAIGVILLFLAYPFIDLAVRITQYLLGDGAARQQIVEFFNGPLTFPQRILVIVLAVAVAPVAEELVFRFFLYGVLRRYFGVIIGLLVSALLFAAVHKNLPSLAPLFVLGCCFTLAYEWSGSILVAMIMHSIFNSVMLVAFAISGVVPQ